MDGGVGGSTGETTCGVLNLLTVWPSTWVIRHRGEGALHRHFGGPDRRQLRWPAG